MDNMQRIRDFFFTYGRLMDEGVKSGKPDAEALASCYASYVVGASPAGVMGGEVKEDFVGVLTAGVENYRKMGATEFLVEDVLATPIDDLHAMARVFWLFGYRRPEDDKTGSIRFENVYFTTLVAGDPKIFAWVTPDEQAALRSHGLI